MDARAHAMANGVVIGVTRHDGTGAVDRFGHERVGLDHIGLGCTSEADVRGWAEHMDREGIGRGPVETAPYGWAVTARDPDGIPVEFFCGRPLKRVAKPRLRRILLIYDADANL